MGDIFKESAKIIFPHWKSDPEICNYLFSAVKKYGKIYSKETGDQIQILLLEEQGTNNKYYLIWDIEQGFPFIEIVIYTQEHFNLLTSEKFLELIKRKYPLSELEIPIFISDGETLNFITIDSDLELWKNALFDEEDELATVENIKYILKAINEFALPNKQKIVVMSTKKENGLRVTQDKATTVGEIRGIAQKLGMKIPYSINKKTAPKIYKPYSKAG